MTSAIDTVQCLVCDTELAVRDDWEVGEIVECSACGQEHEVAERTAEKVRLELAPEVEEDWGE